LDNTVYLSKDYSTTKLLVQEQPTIVKSSEDKFESVCFLSRENDRQGEGGLRSRGYFKKSYENKPLISIITVVFNGEKFLEKTIKSVINQSYDNVEYIIIDGGSTDGTIDIIKKHEDQIDYWVSEKDNGIYDAMNKGLSLVSGAWVNFMNTGDWFCETQTLQKLFDEFIVVTNKVVTGYVKIVDSDGQWKGYRHPYRKIESCDFLRENCIAHQASFVHLSLFKIIGSFSTQYKIQGDYDFWIRVIENSVSIKQLEYDIAYFRDDGISSKRDLHRKSLLEQNKILLSHDKITKKQYYLKIFPSMIRFYLKGVIRFVLGRILSETISHNNFLKSNHVASKIICDMSILGATRAGAYVYALNINKELIKCSTIPILSYKNPFVTLQKKGIVRKLNSLMRLLYMELIVLFSSKKDILFFPAPEASLLAIVLKKRYIVTIHDLYAWKNTKSTTFFARVKNKLLPIVAKNAVLISTISKYSKRDICETFNIDSNKVFITYCGLDEVFTETNITQTVQNLENKSYILNVGSLEPRKNILFLLDVFENIKKDKEQSNLYLVLTGGESWKSKEIIQKIKNSLFHEYIYLLGEVKQGELPWLYRNAHVMVFPSKAEGFGIPVIESLSQNTPVVVQRNSALEEFEAYGVHVLEKFDVDMWKNQIIDIIKTNKRISEDGVQRVLSDFSWKRSAMILQDYLSKTIGV